MMGRRWGGAHREEGSGRAPCLPLCCVLFAAFKLNSLQRRKYCAQYKSFCAGDAVQPWRSRPERCETGTETHTSPAHGAAFCAVTCGAIFNLQRMGVCVLEGGGKLWPNYTSARPSSCHERGEDHQHCMLSDFSKHDEHLCVTSFEEITRMFASRLRALIHASA